MQETTIWRVEREFKTVPYFMKCEVIDGATRYPAQAHDFERQLWNAAVDRKVEVLKTGTLELRVEEVEGRKALWAQKQGQQNFSMVMVPAFVYRLVTYDAEQQVLRVERVCYSEIEALKSSEYRILFENAGLPVPFGPLAPASYITTLDGYITATVRGKGTNKFPGAVYVVGGDIDDPSLTLEEQCKKEEREEFGEEVLGNRIALGITFDKILRKHDIPVLITSNAVFSRIKKGDAYLADVDSFTPIPIRRDELADYLIRNYVNLLDAADSQWIGKPVPSCSVGLYLVGKHLYGNGWAEEVLKQLPPSSESF